MRALLRWIILWALRGAPQMPHDPAELDRAASEKGL